MSGRKVDPVEPVTGNLPQGLTPEEQAAFASRLAEVAKIPQSEAEQHLARFMAGPQSNEHRLLTSINARLAGRVFVQDRPRRRTR